MLCPKGRFIFLKANGLALWKDIDRVCEVTKVMEEEEGREDVQERMGTTGRREWICRL